MSAVRLSQLGARDILEHLDTLDTAIRNLLEDVPVESLEDVQDIAGAASSIRGLVTAAAERRPQRPHRGVVVDIPIGGQDGAS